jgi:hypothetical protein
MMLRLKEQKMKTTTQEITSQTAFYNNSMLEHEHNYVQIIRTGNI